MKTETLERIAELRRENYSYQFIADAVGIPMNTVKSTCRRQGFTAAGPRKTKREKQKTSLCKNCGRLLRGGRSSRLFCSDNCRTAWWKKNRKAEILS